MEFLLAAKRKSRLFEQSARAVLSLGHLKHRLFPLALEFTNQSVVPPLFPPPMSPLSLQPSFQCFEIFGSKTRADSCWNIRNPNHIHLVTAASPLWAHCSAREFSKRLWTFMCTEVSSVFLNMDTRVCTADYMHIGGLNKPKNRTLKK